MKKGDIVYISKDSYSDYTIIGHFRALKDADYREMVKEFVAERAIEIPDSDYRRFQGYKADGFEDWAVEAGYLEEIEAFEFSISWDGLELVDQLYCPHENVTPMDFKRGDSRDAYIGYKCADCNRRRYGG